MKSASAIVAVLLLSACASERILPADLGAPAQVSCINLPDALEATEAKGLFKIVWTTRLARGPYISERENAQGTYYRASPGGVFLGQPKMKDKPAGPGTHMTFDGGIFVPRDPAAAPQLYAYVANDPTAVVPYPVTASCANTSYVRDPVTSKISMTRFAAVSAKGALDGVAGSAAAYNTKAIVGGAAAGALTGAIIAGMMNFDVGKITHLPASTDAAFNAKLGQLARTAVPIVAVEPTAPN